jgi:hypothetical protein
MSDYISREAAIEKMREAGCTDCCGSSDGLCGFCDFENAVRLVKSLPATDVEPVRHGEWRLVRRMAACGEYECSVCGRIETFGCFNKPENNPYCHCGAKMCLEGENNDD